MKLYSILTLYLAQLIMCENSSTILQYNCTTDGLPTVSIIASQGPGLSSVEFFVPMFNNCSRAMDRTTAFFQTGIYFFLVGFIDSFDSK
jgi:hypothetical protein